MFGHIPLHRKQRRFESRNFAGVEIRQGVEHAVVERRRRPQGANQRRIDPSRSLLINPNEIADRAGLRASISDRFENVEFARSRVAVLAEVGIEAH
jgi:hypothetical protein